MSECLVVGGGFLGSNVAAALAARGHDVTVYSRSFSDWLTHADRSGDGAIRLVAGEVPPAAGLRELIAASEVVFYFAGTSTPATAEGDPGGSISGSLLPAAATLDLMRAASSRRVVIASSGGTVYGAARILPTPEDHPTEPIGVHGHNALAIEQYARFYADHHGFEPIVLRYANPYGPAQVAHGGQGVIAAWLQALAAGRPLQVIGDPATRRDFVYVRDAAEATCAAAFGPPGPAVYNVGSATSHALAELLDAIQRVAGRSATIERRPGRGVDVPVTQLDCSRLRAATGWTARTPLDEGLRAAWEWTRERCGA